MYYPFKVIPRYQSITNNFLALVRNSENYTQYLKPLPNNRLSAPSHQTIALETTKPEKKFAFLIMIYNFDNLIGAIDLIQSLYSSIDFFCVHLDKKLSKRHVEFFKGRVKELFNIDVNMGNIHVLPVRFDVKWGNWKIVEIEILMLHYAVQVGGTWEFVMNLW